MQLKVFFNSISLQKIKIANSTLMFCCYFFCILPVCSAQEFEAGQVPGTDGSAIHSSGKGNEMPV